MDFVCPQCKRALASSTDSFRCVSCQRTYPVICEIPDFRLWPGPYIGIDEDRAKGIYLWDAARTRSFEELLRHYYDITAEDPDDLAIHWIAHALAEVEIAGFVLRESGLSEIPGRLLDIGCSTGGMLIAAKGGQGVGVDVAFRWLVVGKARLRDAGISAMLVCANAEALPFPDRSFDLATAQDVIEHVRDSVAAASECRRVSRPGAPALWTTNNRLAPLPEPHVHLWGVGYLPRRWQAGYVAFRRRDLHRYTIRLHSANDLRALFRAAGYAAPIIAVAPLFAPHRKERSLRTLLEFYNGLRSTPFAGAVLRSIGPRLWAKVRR